MVNLQAKYYYPLFKDEEIGGSEKLIDLLKSESKWEMNLKHEVISEFTVYSMHCPHTIYLAQNINPICNFWINSTNLLIWNQCENTEKLKKT